MNPDRRRAILAELEAYAPLPNLGEGEITIQHIMDKWDCSRNRAITWGAKMVKLGKLEKLERHHEGRIVSAWRPAPDARQDNAA